MPSRSPARSELSRSGPSVLGHSTAGLSVTEAADPVPRASRRSLSSGVFSQVMASHSYTSGTASRGCYTDPRGLVFAVDPTAVKAMGRCFWAVTGRHKFLTRGRSAPCSVRRGRVAPANALARVLRGFTSTFLPLQPDPSARQVRRGAAWASALVTLPVDGRCRCPARSQTFVCERTDPR